MNSERPTAFSIVHQAAVTNNLQRQEMRGERLVNHIRLVFSIIGLVGMVPSWQYNTTLANLIFIIQGLFWLVYCLILYLYLALVRDGYRPWLKYATITLDLLLMASVAAATAVNHSGILEYFRSAWLYFFVYWTLFAGFRFTLRSGLYAAALSFVLNTAILWFGVATGRLETTAIADVHGAAINVVDQVIVIVFISAPGLVSGIIASMGRTLVRRTEEETLQRSRLEKEKGRLRRYLSRDLVDMVLEDPDRLEMGGTRRTATIMFTAVRNFTPFSEKRQPEEVVSFLNLYFTRMVSIVFRTGGTLDKYMGDGLLAEYGVPFPVACAPLRAVTAALEMLHALRDFNQSVGLTELSQVQIGVGITTGPVVAGNIGSLERMEYTCIGHTVNAAARLEKLNREFGTNILICERTYEAIKDLVPAQRLPPMKVKGQSSMALYAVEVPDDVPSLVARLDAAMAKRTDAGECAIGDARTEEESE
jgi:class 3 adenylate cyclase